jgi:ABC-type cobalamin transport system permease subunit
MRLTYLILKIIIAISSLFAMYFASHFWIGSKDEWTSAVENGFWQFFFSRLLLTVIIGFFFFLLSLLVNTLFKNKHKISKQLIKKYSKLELIYVISVSIILVSIAVLK